MLPSGARRGLGVLLVGLGIAAPGCAAVLTTLGGSAPHEPPETWCPPEAGALRDVRAIVHCHSFRSHDSDGRDHEIADAARATGTQVIFLTDHPVDAGHAAPPSLIDGVLFVPGVELSKFGGSVLALGVEGPVEPHDVPPDLLRGLRARGAVSVLAHAERYYGPEDALGDLDAYEVYNLHADAVEDSPPVVLVSALFLPPGPFFRTIMDGLDEGVVGRLERLSRARPIALVAGNDSHANVRLFGAVGGQVGSYEETFRLVSTHLLVPPGPLTREVALDAIRRGRTFVAFEQDASAAGFRFVARTAEGLYTSGDTVPPGSPVELEAIAPHGDAEVRLLRDGAVVAKSRHVARLAAAPPGLYRVEARLGGRPWILATGILVR